MNAGCSRGPTGGLVEVAWHVPTKTWGSLRHVSAKEPGAGRLVWKAGWPPVYQDPHPHDLARALRAGLRHRDAGESAVRSERGRLREPPRPLVSQRPLRLGLPLRGRALRAREGVPPVRRRHAAVHPRVLRPRVLALGHGDELRPAQRSGTREPRRLARDAGDLGALTASRAVRRALSLDDQPGEPPLRAR